MRAYSGKRTRPCAVCREESRNHIRGYVARNLARPVWLASEAQKADVVIGNPPWVSYRYMRGDFKARFRQESRAAKLGVGGKVATQHDLSTYFSLRAVGLYLRRSGRLPVPQQIFGMAPPFFHAGWSWSISSHRREDCRRTLNFYSYVGLLAASTGHRGKPYQRSKAGSKNGSYDRFSWRIHRPVPDCSATARGRSSGWGKK